MRATTFPMSDERKFRELERQRGYELPPDFIEIAPVDPTTESICNNEYFEDEWI
jgi:hypothetical protein